MRRPSHPQATNLGENPAEERNITNSNNTTRKCYKNHSPKKHYCSFRCGLCEIVGNDLVAQKYQDFGNILLEDDSNLIYNLFGRELVK